MVKWAQHKLCFSFLNPPSKTKFQEWDWKKEADGGEILAVCGRENYNTTLRLKNHEKCISVMNNLKATDGPLLSYLHSCVQTWGVRAIQVICLNGCKCTQLGFRTWGQGGILTWLPHLITGKYLKLESALIFSNLLFDVIFISVRHFYKSSQVYNKWRSFVVLLPFLCGAESSQSTPQVS